MTPFEHLAVLISIVIGLGITQLLISVQRLVQAREQVRLYWLPLVWTALIFVGQVEWWWSIWGKRHDVSWNFFYFLYLLLVPVVLFLAAALVLPDVSTELASSEVCDLRQYYYRWRRWLFGALALNPGLDGLRRWAEVGHWSDTGVWTNLVGAVLLASLVFSRRAWCHAVVTVVVGAIFFSFIVTQALLLR